MQFISGLRVNVNLSFVAFNSVESKKNKGRLMACLFGVDFEKLGKH